MAAFRNGLVMPRRWFVLLTLLAFGLALAIGAFLWHAVQTSSVVAIQTRIEMMKPTFTGSRESSAAVGSGTSPARAINALNGTSDSSAEPCPSWQERQV